MMLFKELVRLETPERAVSCFKFFRDPQVSSLSHRLRHALIGTPCVTDGYWYGDLVVAADGYHYSTAAAESAIFFASWNTNILRGTDSVLKEAVTQRVQDKNLAKLIMYKLTQLSYQASYQTSSGTLYAICVPKNKVQRIAYRAHAYGYRCRCHPFKNPGVILDKLQQGTLDDTTKCQSGQVPQYRLIARELTPENGVLCFRLTAMERTRRRQLREQVRAIAEEIFIASAA